MDLSISLCKQQKSILELKAHIPKNVKSLGIFGASGAGKTSLLRCLAGLEPQMQGSVKWDLETINTQAAKPRISLVFQQGVLFPHLNVAQNFEFAEKFKNKHCLHKCIKELNKDTLLDTLEIRHLLDHQVEHLSGGEQQRVAIARALLNCPDVLLMDEAVSALDKRLKQKVLAYIVELVNKGLNLVFVSHALRELAMVCEHLLHIDEGKVLANAQKADLLSHLQLDENTDKRTISTHPLFSLLSVEHACVEHLANSQLRLCKLGSVELYTHSLTEINGQVEMRVDANQVVISKTALEQSSMLNILPVRLSSYRSLNGDQVLLELLTDIPNTNKQKLSAIISNISFERLGILPNDALFACFKAH